LPPKQDHADPYGRLPPEAAHGARPNRLDRLRPAPRAKELGVMSPEHLVLPFGGFAMPDEDNKLYEERLHKAAEDMVDSGKSLDDASQEFGVDRDELSKRFGEEMVKRYGQDGDDDEDDE